MLRSVFAKALYDQRRMFVWWSLGIVVVSLVYIASYKTYAETGMLDTEMPEYLGALMGAMDYGSPEGYLTSTFFTLIGAWMTVAFALVIGVRAVAGIEDSGMLDVILAHPVSRARFVLERFAALAVSLAVFGAVTWAAVSIAAGISEMGLPLANIAAACSGLALVGLVFGTVALAVGALTGRTGVAYGVTVAAALAGFLANNLAPMLEGLDFARKLSPFHYYLRGDPLRAGFDAGGSAVLVAAAAIFAGLAVWGLNRRDVRV